MKEVSQVTVQFPYLMEPGENGLMFSGEATGTLDALINYSEVSVPVTLYSSMGEYKYAIGSTVRYATVDPMFQIGKVVSFDTVSRTMVLEVPSDVSDSVLKAKVLPRALINKVKNSATNTEMMQLNRLVCIDMISVEEEINE